MFPRPEASAASLLIKKGQSLPSFSAILVSSPVVRGGVMKVLSSLSIKAESALPPARPAPVGMPLCRCMCSGGNSDRGDSDDRCEIEDCWEDEDC